MLLTICGKPVDNYVREYAPEMPEELLHDCGLAIGFHMLEGMQRAGYEYTKVMFGVDFRRKEPTGSMSARLRAYLKQHQIRRGPAGYLLDIEEYIREGMDENRVSVEQGG